MKKILSLISLCLIACVNQEETKLAPVQEVAVSNFDSLIGKEVLVLKVDDWSDWMMWNEERTKVQGHIYAGQTSTILDAKEIQGVLRYKLTNSEGQVGYIQSDVCQFK